MKNKLIALLSKENRTFLLWCIVVFLVVLLIGVMAISPDRSIFMYLTGDKSKLELIKLIGWGISGLIAILGVRGLLQRASALDEQNKITRDGQRHERLKTANERLAHKDEIVRIASFNEFYYLASIESDLRGYIFITLCEHLQQIIKDNNRKDMNEHEKIEPTNEEKSLLNILFKNNSIFDKISANLAEINLQNANLQNTKLQDANLQKANLQGVNLQKANLQNANLQNANLQMAKLQNANLQGANLLDADLHVAHLQNANLQDVELYNANLLDANLRRANLQNANMLATRLQHANLQYANLQKADMQGAKLQGIDLQKANLQGANLQSSDLQDAYLSGAYLSGANLQGVNLQRAKLRYADLHGADLQVADLQGADLTSVRINKKTIMPDGWENMVKRNKDGKTGVQLVDDEENVIENL